jgi:hypothetical protein
MCQGTDTVLKTKLFGLKEIHGAVRSKKSTQKFSLS